MIIPTLAGLLLGMTAPMPQSGATPPAADPLAAIGNLDRDAFCFAVMATLAQNQKKAGADTRQADVAAGFFSARVTDRYADTGALKTVVKAAMSQNASINADAARAACIERFLTPFARLQGAVN